MLLPGDARSNIVRTLSVEGVGDLKLIRTERRETRLPWRLSESFEWEGKTASGVSLSLDRVASAELDPPQHALDRVKQALELLPDIRRSAARLMWESARTWAKTPSLAEAAFAEMLTLDGINYMMDDDPSGDILEVYLMTHPDIFGDHAILCEIDLAGRVTRAELAG